MLHFQLICTCNVGKSARFVVTGIDSKEQIIELFTTLSSYKPVVVNTYEFLNGKATIVFTSLEENPEHYFFMLSKHFEDIGQAKPFEIKKVGQNPAKTDISSRPVNS